MGCLPYFLKNSKSLMTLLSKKVWIWFFRVVLYFLSLTCAIINYEEILFDA